MRFFEFEITIQRKFNDYWPIIVRVKHPDGLTTHTEGRLQLSEEDWSKLSQAQENEKEYGTLLGKALFLNDVRETFIRNLSQSSQQCLLRIMLSNETDPKDELKTLHWERLCAPIDAGGAWNLLARDQRVPFSLYIPTIIDRRFPPIGRRDLRALVLVASPSNLDNYHLASFDVEAVVKSIRQALSDIPCDVLANVEGANGPPTLEGLSKQLTNAQKPYTLLHFVCHGMLSKEGETALFWAAEDNQLKRVTGTELLDELSYIGGQHSLPHFAFLCTCESADPRAEGTLGGLAQRLVRTLGMPAVVAMTRKVSVRTALALKQHFYQRLRESGVVDVALQEATAGLGNLPDITVPALFSRLGGNPLFSDRLEDRELTDVEIDDGITDLRQLIIERAPNATVLKQNLETQVETLNSIRGSGVPRARQQRSQAVAELNTLCNQVLDISFDALAALGKKPPVYNAECPFPGLSSFRDPKYHKFFFGRDSLIDELQKKLKEHNFLVVVGPSGSGKSSVVLAGLIPRLKQQQSNLQMVYLRPGTRPLERLKTSFSEISDPTASILVVDQFEELFANPENKDDRQAFITQLIACSQHQTVIITMRSDFLGECATYIELNTLINSGRQILIGAMNAAELGQAIKKQADTANLEFEEGLSNTILAEVVQEQEQEDGAMPLLQFGLQELWNRRRGRWLCFEEYKATGGIREAIAQTAKRVYDSLSSKEEQDQFRSIFVRLTSLNEVTEQEKERYTRRRVELEELVPAGGDLVSTKKLVKDLADEGARLVVTSRNKVTQKEEVEVAHEALIEHWQQLKDWIKADETDLEQREDIRRAAQIWYKNQKKGYLKHRDESLPPAEKLLNRPGFLNQLEHDYVTACVKLNDHQKQEKSKRSKLFTRISVIVALVMVVLAVVAYWQATVAKSQKNIAESQKNNSEVNALSFKVKNLFSSGLDIEALEEALKVGNKLKQKNDLTKSTRLQAIATLQEVVYGVHELNRLEHNNWVLEASFSPDGKWIASASYDSNIRLWSLDGREKPIHISDYLGLDNKFGYKGGRMEFSPDSKAIAYASKDDKSVKILPLNGESPKILLTGKVSNIYFYPNPDINILATAGEDDSIKLWSINNNNDHPLLTLTGSKNIVSIAISPDGNILSATSKNGIVKLWTISIRSTPNGTITEAHELQTLQEGPASTTSTSFSPDGNFLAIAGKNIVQLWNLENLEKINKKTTIRGVEGENFLSLAFKGYGNSLLIATGSDGGMIRFWNLDGTPISTILKYGRQVFGVRFSPDGKMLASAGDDNNVKLWSVEDLENNREITKSGHRGGISLSPDGQTLAYECDRKIELLDLKSMRRASMILESIDEKPDGKPKSLNFSRDGKSLVAFSSSIQAWKLPDKPYSLSSDSSLCGSLEGELIKPFFKIDKNLPSFSYIANFSPDGNILASGHADGSVKLWSLQSQQLLKSIDPHNSWVTAIRFSPNGKWIASGSYKKIKLWDVEKILNNREAQPESEQNGHGNLVQIIQFSEDSKALISGSWDKTIRVWDVETKQQKKIMKGHQSHVDQIALSPDGQFLASASSDRTVKLWDLYSGEELHSFIGHKNGVGNVFFTNDGKTLISGSDQIIFWNLDLNQLMKKGCQWLDNYLKNNPSGQKEREDYKICTE
jgi:WD40 repeat protein/energy-coupling factor transporter ATP-binding protein EcfA2